MILFFRFTCLTVPNVAFDFVGILVWVVICVLIAAGGWLVVFDYTGDLL